MTAYEGYNIMRTNYNRTLFENAEDIFNKGQQMTQAMKPLIDLPVQNPYCN